MLQFAGIIKPKTWIIAGVALVVFVGIIVSLTGAGHRGDGSSEPQAVSQPASHPAEAVAENEMAKHGASPGKLPTPAPTAAAKEHVDSPRANVRHSVTLWNSAGNEFESNLLEAMGGRIASRRREDGRPEYLLSFGGGQGSRLRIDSEANKVLIEGREGPVRGVVQLVHALDKPSTAAGVGIRCISAPRFRGEEIKRLMQAVRMDEKSRAKGSCKGTSSENPEPMAVAFQVGAGGDAKAKQPRADSPKGGEKRTAIKSLPSRFRRAAV